MSEQLSKEEIDRMFADLMQVPTTADRAAAAAQPAVHGTWVAPGRLARWYAGGFAGLLLLTASTVWSAGLYWFVSAAIRERVHGVPVPGLHPLSDAEVWFTCLVFCLPLVVAWSARVTCRRRARLGMVFVPHVPITGK